MGVSLKKYVFGHSKTPAVTYNTEIGGVSATISTASALATKLGISVGRIENFTIVGSDIKCKITGSYGIPADAFRDNTTITYYRDYENCTSIGNTAFYHSTSGLNFSLYDLYFENAITINTDVCQHIGSGDYPLKKAVFPKATTFNGIRHFFNQKQIEVVYIPLVTNLGQTLGSDQIFDGTNFSAQKKLYCHPSLATNNGGSPDGDITNAIANGWIIRYVTNFTAPSPITTLSAGTIYKTAIQLIFTAPSSTNAIDFYECYVNGIYKGNVTASGQYITGLTASTNYNITLVAVDIFYNKSVVSNSVTQSTNTTAYLGDKVVAAYGLSDGVDAKNAYNGTVGSSVTFSAGKNGNGANFIQNTNSKITIPYNSAFTFNDGTNDLPFSTSTWIKLTSTTNYFIFSKGVSNRLYELSGTPTTLLFRLSSNGNISNRIEVSASFTPALNTWYHIVSTYNGNKLKTGMNLYINGVLQTVTRSNFGTTYLGLSTASEPVYLGHFNPLSGYNLEGMMDENYWFNDELNQAEVTLLQTSYYPF